MGDNALGGIDDVGDVGVFGLAQRRRHTDGDGVHVGQRGVVGAGAELSAVHQRRDDLRRHILDVALASLQGRNLARVQIDADDGEPLLGKSDGQRQADVAQADDADSRLAAGDALQ
jgi:hypothetical protein